MPTVQVLDQPVVPEKKAHPHRLIVIAGGTGFGVFFGMIWIVGAAMWEQTDPRQPWKQLTQEIIATTWDSPRGRRLRARLLRRGRAQKPDSPDEADDAGASGA